MVDKMKHFYVLGVQQVALDNTTPRNDPIVFSKRSRNRRIQKEIEMQ